MPESHYNCTNDSNMTTVTRLMRSSLGRHDPSTRKDVVFFGEKLSHSCQVSTQQIFAANLSHSWKMVDFLQVFDGGLNPLSLVTKNVAYLVPLHVHDPLHHDRSVHPVDSPVFSLAYHRL